MFVPSQELDGRKEVERVFVAAVLVQRLMMCEAKTIFSHVPHVLDRHAGIKQVECYDAFVMSS